MTDAFDLWEDEILDLPAYEPEIKETPVATTLPAKEVGPTTIPTFAGRAMLRLVGNSIQLFTKGSLRGHASVNRDLDSMFDLTEEVRDGVHCYYTSLSAINAFVLRHVLKLVDVTIAPADGQALKHAADRLTAPTATLSSTGKHVDITTPNIRVYQEILNKVSAYPVKGGYRVGINKILDLEAIMNMALTTLPPIVFDQSVLDLTRQPIPNFDGSLDSLKAIPLGALNVVNSNMQNWKHVKTDNATLEEKFAKFGIANLHDLLFYLPKHFIDKSNPQEISDLMEGESITTIGKLSTIGELPNRKGVIFIIENEQGQKLKVSFWSQLWLKTKFKVGDEVLVTGKVKRFMGKIELGGSSIEHSEEAAVLPIVPIYKQSDTKGVTTQLIMAAAREFLSRVETIDLPPYLRRGKAMDYHQALQELHFPTSLENFNKACTALAYYELVYMQLLMQEEKSSKIAAKGLAQPKTARDLQNKAVGLLSFKLTQSQVDGVRKIDGLLASEEPTQMLLNADVGSGKSLCAQLACLRVLENNRQAVIVCPTEILARQLFETTEKIVNLLTATGERVSVAFLGAGMKAAEKKPIIKGVADGTIDILVGTTSVIADKVIYHNLGLVVIDEQQKFGAEQRTKLLSSRSDGLVPDLLMMSATPIPRSAAQVFYGDMEMVELKEKPPGRLPIQTEWIMDDPIEFAAQLMNPVWRDVAAEASKGNQTFVITPMVVDSDNVDAASVERTFESLSRATLAGLTVGYVHGRMKKPEQQQVMDDFKNKKYMVLVASTVIEVGVDIADATRVVILSADRLGAASLHQIRGRVGRNSKPSKCYLVSLGKTNSSQMRLQSLVDSENGFDIALADLDVRGEGKMFSSEQSGSNDMLFASIARHGDFVPHAKADALKILESHYRVQALEDARHRFSSSERLF